MNATCFQKHWLGRWCVSLVLIAMFSIPVAGQELSSLDITQQELILLGWQQNRDGLLFWSERLAAVERPAVADLVLLAAGYFYLGEISPPEQAEKLFARAKEVAAQAREMNPRSADALYWQTVAQGRIGSMVPLLRQLAAVEPLHDGLQQVLALDPAHGYAHLALSILYEMAPGRPLSLGSRTRSLDHAEQAYALDPTNPEFSRNLAAVYVRERRTAEARQLLQDLLQQPDIAEYPGWQAELEHLLAEAER